MSRFRFISDEWMSDKKAREKAFSLGKFSEEYLSHFPFAVVKRNSEIIAFANIWEGFRKGRAFC